MKSMTGYGAVEGHAADAEFSIVVKSVNGRFLETRFHLPREYFSLESQFKKEIAALLERGTVDVFVYRRGSGDLSVRFNSQNAKKWIKAHRQMAKALHLPLNEKNLAEKISSLPQVFETGDRAKIAESEVRAVLKAFRAAVTSCLQERAREGRSLCRHLESVLQKLKKVVTQMERLRESANRDLEAKLRERLRKISKEFTAEPARFADELVYYLDKSDIGEELTRLEEHLETCAKSVSSGEVSGKKLDFYGQELLREVNTIGSKANHAQLTELVVEAKSLIEAFKEQVQNVE